MTAPGRAAPTSPPSRGAGRPVPRSPALGLVALLLVPVVIALTLIAPQLVALAGLELEDVQLLGYMLTGEAIAMAVVLLLGLVAVLTRRGRVFGAVAMVLALLLNPFTLSVVLRLLGGLAPQP